MSGVPLGLKIDVDTLRGTQEGVPRLVALLDREAAGASFFFSLGPDHTGRALRRVFRRGFLSKVTRTSVLEHYGLRTLLYGTLLPGPDIGRRCAPLLRRVREAGFEVGVHCWDHVRWQDHVAEAGADWTRREMDLALHRFGEVFGVAASSWAAAGWQTNVHAARLQARARLAYASDTRGAHPFVPVWDGERAGPPQLPTTLPTLDELIGLEADPVSALLALSLPLRAGHIFTAHAELEGARLIGALEALIRGWRNQGYEIVSLEHLYRSLGQRALPTHAVRYGELRGRSGRLAMQAEEILA